jgi:ribosomal protein S18 acetylase RimI-like enzyme
MSRLLRLTWRRAFSGLLTPSELAEVSRRFHAPAGLAEQTRQRDCFFSVAVSKAGRLLGLVTAARDGARRVFLNRLYVRPGRQGGGLGDLLLARAWKAFPKAGTMRLEVLRDNLRARAFYRGHGFRVVGRGKMTLETRAVPLAVMEAARPAKQLV